MKIEFINQSQEGGNGKPSTNHFIFRNTETNGQFVIGEITVISYFKNGENVSREIGGVIWSAKSMKLSEESVKRIFEGYLKLAHDKEFMESFPPDEKDILGLWKQCKFLYHAITQGFPTSEVEYV